MKYLIENPEGKRLTEIPGMGKENAEWVADALTAAFWPKEYKAVPEKGEPSEDESHFGFSLSVENFE